MLELITIIVPVYKVEKYLSRCVDSLLKQTYKNIEIILVDDGSPDNCGKICDKYTKLDERVKVIHKKNGGLSDARNTAIPLACGQFITFVDSDDWVSKYYAEHLYKVIKKNDADLAISQFDNVFEESKQRNVSQKPIKNYKCLTSGECLKKLLYQDGVECCACGKLYKKEIISDMRYPVGKLYEDILVTYECIKRSNKIAVISNIDYFYFQRKDSIQYKSFNIQKLDGVKHCGKMLEAVKKDYPELAVAAECRYISTVCNILFQIRDKKYIKERQGLWQEIKKYRKDVLLDKNARKKARLAALVSYCGYSIMSFVYHKTQLRG